MATVPRHPRSTSARDRARAASPSGSVEDDPQSVIIRFFDEDGIDVDEATQRKIERALLPRGIPPGAGRGDRRHRVPAPGPRALHGGADDRRRRRGHRRRAVQARPRLRLRHRQLRHAERAGQAGGRGPGREPLRRYRRRGVERPRRLGLPGGRPRPGLGGPPGCGHRPRRGALTLVDDEGRVLTDDEALLLMLELVVATDPRLQGGPARGRAHGGRADLRRRRRRDRLDEALGHPPHGGLGRRRGHLRRQPEGGFIFPGFLPAFDAVATLVHLLGMLADTGQSMAKLTGRLPTVQSPTTRWSPPGSRRAP